MPIQRLNHAVFYIRDVATTKRFYSEVLGFETMVEDPAGKFLFMRAPLSENHHDIAFFAIGQGAGATTAGRSAVGLYHVAWEVGTIAELEEMRVKLLNARALIGASDHGVSLSLYSRDPDGLEFEVMWQVPPEHWGSMAHEAIIEPLDLKAKQNYFAQFGLS
jgi:catechol-2,3-dioxygenase